MKVLCVGFPKTGTKSLNAALTELGYEVYDYEENFYYLGKQWTKIFTKGGTVEDFRKMYENVDATVDIPASYFWEEILEAFPDVKIIFMQRDDEQKWLASWERQARSPNESLPLKMLSIFSPTGNAIFRYSRHMGRIVFASDSVATWKVYTGISPTVALKRYRDHNHCVLTKAPKDQTLNFKLKEGWEPLCNFLGKEIPNKPFPHKNQRSSLVDDYLNHSPIFAAMKREMYVCFGVLGLAAIGGSVYMYRRPTSVTGGLFRRLKFWKKSE